MSARRLSIVLLFVLCGACLIAPASVLGENPWDEADRPGGGRNRSIDTVITDDTTSIDTTGAIDQSLSSSPISPNETPDTFSSWVYDMVLYFGSFFRF